jgi:protoheme IX farnesyltransferase
MLPVVAGVERTTRQIILYTAIVGLVSLALVPVADLGWIYLLAAVVLGLGFLVEAFRLNRDPSRAMRLFTYSNVYLALLFAAVWIDATLS